MSDAIDLSLGEWEALCAKAACGAGHPWGVAMEYGRAARAAAAAGAPLPPFAAFLEAAPAPCPLLAGLADHDGAAGPHTDPQWTAIRDAAAGRTGAPIATRAPVDAATFAALSALAHRTYAPATEESRAKGAG